MVNVDMPENIARVLLYLKRPGVPVEPSALRQDELVGHLAKNIASA
jgi:hypothetical protein